MQKTRTINNWKPVIKSLLNACLDQGLTISGVNDGDEETLSVSTVKEAVDIICEVDESSLYLKTPDGKTVWAWIVLGNEPCETLADYAVNDLLEKAFDQFSKSWEGRSVPKKEVKI